MQKKLPIIIVSVLGVLIIIALVIYFVLFANSGYTGFVYEEGTNKPIQGVCVTDGRNVVKTKEDGSYELKGYKKTHFVTVTVPSGYTSNKYYIPVSKDVGSYDFCLAKEKTPTNEHSFLQVADTEIGKDGVGDWLNHTKKLVDELNPAFLIHTGDICYTDGLKQHIVDMNSETMGIPVRYVIGNHDYVDGKYGEELFESLYGPVWYSFEVGNVHYIVTPIQTGDVRSNYSRSDRWRWLKNDIENTDTNKEIIIFNHTNAKDNGLKNYSVRVGTNKLNLLEHNLKAWIFGHYHYNYINENNGVLDISTGRPDSGGIDQSPSGTRQIIIDKNGNVTTKMHYYDFEPSKAVTPGNVWNTKLDGNVLFSDTLVVDNKVFVGTSNDDYPHDCGVYSLDAKTGEILWSFKTKNSVKNDLVYTDNMIIAQDGEGNVYAINAQTGKEIWSYQTKFSYVQNTSLGIIADDKNVYVGNSTVIAALNIKNGEVVWTTSQSGGENSPTSLQLSGDKLIVGSQWRSLYALNINTGKMLWENKDEKIRFRSSTPLCIDDNKILLASVDAVMIIDSNTGKIINKTVLEGQSFDVSSQPLVVDNIAYIATATKGVIAFDLKTKKQLWNFETKKALVYTSPYISGDSKTVETNIKLDGENLVFGASDGFVYQINKSDGTLVKEIQVGAPIFSTIAVYEDSFIVSDFAGRVIRIAK